MAGDWIKFEVGTPDKPEVWAIAGALNIDPDAVVGKLLRVWAWFDTHTESGNAPSVSTKLLDRLVGVTGFCDAVIDAGWLHIENGQLSISNFERHNGETAKTRALTAKRVAKHKSKSNGTGNGKVTPRPLPKEEKRREEESKDSSMTDAQFEALWSAYPKRSGSNPKDKARKALSARLKAGERLAVIAAGVERYRRHCLAGGKIGTEFVMQAARFFGPGREYLNDWEESHATRQHHPAASRSDRADQALAEYLAEVAADAARDPGDGLDDPVQPEAGDGSAGQYGVPAV